MFIVLVWFDARKSWVNKNGRDSKSLLLHEQVHFDLAELLARQLRKQFSETVFNIGSFRDTINHIVNLLLKKNYAQQWQYDKVTDYGTKNRQQQYWQLSIKAELQKLNAYQGKNFTAPLK